MIETQGKDIQQVSDEIARALIKQGRRCMMITDRGQCSYSDGEGSHCAVGWLLPDSEELRSFPESLEGMVNNYPHLLGENEEFIRNHFQELFLIQDMHDFTLSVDMNRVREELEKLGLNTDAWEPWVSREEPK